MPAKRPPPEPQTPDRAPETLAPYRAPALEKGLDVLELLADVPEPLTASAIAARLGRSPGEIFRMLAVLEQRGYIATDEGREGYQLTMRLLALAHRHLPVNRLTRAAAGPMQRLAMGTGQSCHLSVRTRGGVTVVARQDSFRDRSFSMRVGAEAPLFQSCSGRIFHALADPFTRETDCAQTGVDAATAAATAALEAGIRADGMLEIPSRQVAGILDMGAPVFDHDGRVAAVLIIPFLDRLDDAEGSAATARRALVATARAISASLGATG